MFTLRRIADPSGPCSVKSAFPTVGLAFASIPYPGALMESHAASALTLQIPPMT